MSETIRTERRFGVTSQLTQLQRSRLTYLVQSETWSDVLDVLEMACIEIETDLINTPAEDEAAVLANHKLSKAAWKIFEQMQDKILAESSRYMESVAPKPPVPELTAEEQWTENVLDPTKPPPPDDYMGIG
jgi:hypothetical protein